MKHQILTAAILAALLLLTVACKDEVTPPPAMTTEGQSQAPTSSETTDAITTSPGTTAPETEPVTQAPGTTTPDEPDEPKVYASQSGEMTPDIPVLNIPIRNVEYVLTSNKEYSGEKCSFYSRSYFRAGTSYVEYDCYAEGFMNSYTDPDRNYKGYPTIREQIDKYTEEWFAENSLLILFCTGIVDSQKNTYDAPPELNGIYVQNKNEKGEMYMDMDLIPLYGPEPFMYWVFVELAQDDLVQAEKLWSWKFLLDADAIPETTAPVETDPPVTQPPETTAPEDTTPPYTEPKFDPAAPYRLITPTDVTTVYAKDRDGGSGFRGQIAMHLNRNDVFDRGFTLFDMDSTLLGLPSLNDMKQRYPDPEEKILILFYVTTNDPEALTHATLVEDYDGTVQPPPALRGIYLQNGNLFVDLEECYAPSHLGLEREPGCYMLFIDISDADRALLEELSPEQWYGIMKIGKS